MSQQPPGLRHAIIGCGRIASLFDEESWSLASCSVPQSYLSAIQAQPDRKVVAICDRDPVRLEACASKRNIAVTVQDPFALIKNYTFDVLWICTPLEGRGEILLRALEHGVRHIVYEKPIAQTSSEGECLLREITKAGATVHVPFLRRFNEGIQNLAKNFQSGKWGGIQQVVMSYTKEFDNSGPHAVDLLYQILGKMPFSTLRVAYRGETSRARSPQVVLEGISEFDPFFVTLVSLDHAVYSLFEVDFHFKSGRVQILDDGSVRAWNIENNPDFPDYRSLAHLQNKESGSPDVLGNFVKHVEEVFAGKIKAASTFEQALEGFKVVEKILC